MPLAWLCSWPIKFFLAFHLLARFSTRWTSWDHCTSSRDFLSPRVDSWPHGTCVGVDTGLTYSNTNGPPSDPVLKTGWRTVLCKATLDLNSSRLMSPVFWRLGPRGQGVRGQVSSKVPLACRWPPSPHVFMSFIFPDMCGSSFISSSYEHSSRVGLSPILVSSF